MRCVLVREALSAWYDGEPADADPAQVSAHVASCRRCTAFQAALGAITEATKDAPTRPGPSLPVMPRRHPNASRRPLSHARTTLLLRWGTGLAGATAIALAIWEVVGPGAHADHEAHESLAFTLGVCLGLVCAAVRPQLARGYLPVIGLASLVLFTTSAMDVGEGHVGMVHEFRHLAVLVGSALLALLCLHDPDAPQPTTARRPDTPLPVRRLRLLTRAVLATSAGAALLAAVTIAAAPASAHALLEQTTPSAGTLVKEAPTTVSLRFSEPVTLLPDSVQVFGPDGSRVDQDDVAHVNGAGSTAAVSLGDDLDSGTYLVSWRVVSADSHPIGGTFTFSYGERGAVPTVSAHAAGNDRFLSILLGASRWVGYAGSALGLGGAAFLCWCWPAGWQVRRARRLVVAGGVMLALGSLAALLIKGAYDAGLGIGDVLRWTLFHEVIGTTFGRAQLARVVLAVLLVLVAAYVAPAWRRVETATLVVAIGVDVALTFAASGHAAAGSDRVLRLASDTVHVLAMSVWLGGLVMLLTVVLAGRVGDRTDGADVLAPVLRFSPVAAGCTAALVATGTYQAWRQVASWGGLFHTSYGRDLLIKLGFVALALLAAAGSRLWVWRTRHPVVTVQAATSTAPEVEAQPGPRPAVLRRSVALESLAIVGVLALTSVLVSTEPAATSYHPSVSQQLTVGPDTVQVDAVPIGDRELRLTLDIRDSTGAPSDPKQVTATVSLADKNISPVTVRLTRTGVGQRRGRISVPVTGDWRLAVTVRTSPVDEATEYVDVPVR